MKQIINHNHNLIVEKEFEHDSEQFINLDRSDLDMLVSNCEEVHSFVAESADGIASAVDDMSESIAKSGIRQNVRKVILQISISKNFGSGNVSELADAVKSLMPNGVDCKWGVRWSAIDDTLVRLLLVAGW